MVKDEQESNLVGFNIKEVLFLCRMVCGDVKRMVVVVKGLFDYFQSFGLVYL